MEVSRILRVMITLILVVSFIAITVAAYRRNQEVNSMTTLADATSSIAARLAFRDLALMDERGIQYPYILDGSKLENLDKSRSLAGENFRFRVSISYLRNGSERGIGPYGEEPPKRRMTCSLSVPVALQRSGTRVPAKLEVVAWYA